ncbi:MAG: hypothetical protein IBJ13_03360, partial [Sphingopyxis sp.]|nr:hypothetical protein [Sphingopyxis sp.]
MHFPLMVGNLLPGPEEVPETMAAARAAFGILLAAISGVKPGGDETEAKLDALFVWARETIPAPMGQFVECKVFDFSVSELPSEEALAAWAGRKPDQSMDLSDGKLRIWFDGDDRSTSMSIQTPPCFRNPCEQPRLVIERSVFKK